MPEEETQILIFIPTKYSLELLPKCAGIPPLTHTKRETIHIMHTAILYTKTTKIHIMHTDIGRQGQYI